MHNVVLAAGTPIAADAGALIAEAGGNAVDVGVATILTSMATEPGIVAPGSAGFLTIDVPGSEPIVVDGYAEMAGRGADPDCFGSGRRVHMDYGGGVSTIIGYGAVAVPGIYAALDLAWRRYGSLPWNVLFEPAIEAVANGFPLSSAASEYLAFVHESVYGWDPEMWRIVHTEEGAVLTEGDIVRPAHLSDTLAALADEGVGLLYRGELGAMLVDAAGNDGGILTRRDLAEYEAIVRTPTRFRIGEWLGATNPPPAVGGVTLAGILGLVESLGVDHDDAAYRIEQVYRYQQAVLGFRRDRFVAAGSVEAAAAELLEAAGAGDIQTILGSPSTSHTSVADASGMTVAITVSAGYGSGACPQGTGFWLNNLLGEVELNPSGYHGLNPGTRIVSNMAPTTLRSPQGALAVGSPGADRITTAMASVMVHYAVLGRSLVDSVLAPRIHAEVTRDDLDVSVEQDAVVDRIPVDRMKTYDPLSMYFGGAQAAFAGADGHLEGAADPRRAGAVRIVKR